MRSAPKVRTTGFTLVEVMIGVAIIAIAMALGMPSYTVWIQNTKLRNAAESLSSGLKLARSEAVSRNSPVRFSFGPASNSSWIMGCITVTAGCPATIQSRAVGDGSSSTIKVTKTGFTAVDFDNLGRRAAPVAANGVTIVDVTSSALSTADNRNLRITIDVGGNVLMCDPSVVAPDSRAC